MSKLNLASCMILLSLCFILAARGEEDATCPALEDINYEPVIGILSHPRKYNGSYIAASYVKFVQAGGARVIPLIFDEPWSVLSAKLDLVNGVVFTGGVRQYSDYVAVVRKIFEKVKEKNEGGEHFPLYAMNLGFELLLKIASGNNDILESIDAQKMKNNLQLVSGVDIHGTVIGSFPLYLRNKLKRDCLASFNHKYGISKEKFDSDEQLTSFFKALTTTVDRNQKEYVSTMQAYNYPITAFQWDPEKNAFEWGSSEIPHSLYAIQVTQQTANYFISEARKSSNKPSTQDVLDNLIYKYDATYTGADGKGFDQTYYFDAYESTVASE